MATKKFTDEQLNYFRLSSVITNDVPEGLRTVFKQQWNARYQATHGQWLDTAHNATDFYNMESPKNRSSKKRLLTIMANGNSNQWDCTCLFYALLFSDCLGPFLNTAVKKNVDELREIRNEVFHTADGRLTDVDFEDTMQKILVAFTALGLDTMHVNEMKTQKSFPTDDPLSKLFQQQFAQFHSFCALPPKPSHDTTDRADEIMTISNEMEKLRSTKKNETTVIYLSGNPGCGKSEIARQIGNNYFKNIPEETTQLKFVFTFNASSIDTLVQSYVDFAARLNCDEDSVTRIATSKDSPEEKIQKLKSLINPKVQIYSWWLIIVDNVNDLKLVSKYLPQAGEKTSGDGQILVTTQDSQSIPIDSYTYHYSSLKLGMKEEDSIALLSQISGCQGDRATLHKIASALDFQPLALACAAVYMQRILNCTTDQSETKWEKYLLKLQEGKRKATEEVFEKTNPTYQSAMTAAVRLALERVVSEDKIMMHALQFLSVIANKPIQLKYVVQYVINCMPDEDQDLVAAHISLSSLVISSDDEENSDVIRVHQVVYYVLQKLFENDETDMLKLMSVFSYLNSLINPYSVTKAEIIATRSFTPHFMVISRKLSMHLLDHSNLTDESLTADCLFKAGSICLVQGSYNASKIFLELCLSIQQRAYNSSPEMTQGLNLSSNIPAINKSDEDKPSHVERKLTCSGNVSVALATTLNTLGDLYRRLTDYKTAQIHLEAALLIQERAYQGDHLELVITLNSLGACLRNLGEHGKAEAYLQRALAIQEKNCGKNDFLLADILINLVLLHQSQGESKKSKTYCERVLEYEQTLHDSESPRLSVMLHNLGLCLSNFKEKQKATTFYEKALKIDEGVYHANHPYQVITLEGLGNSLEKLEKYEEAKSYHEKALAIIENGNDQNDPRLILALNNVGFCLTRLKEFDKARAYYERMLSMCNKGNDENDSILATTLHNLGVCLNKLGQYEKAKAYWERALSIREKGENRNKLANTLHGLGECLHGQQQYEMAKAFFERALSIREQGDDENDPEMAKTVNDIGVCLKEQNQCEKAIAYYERALSIYEKGDNENNPWPGMAGTLDNLGLCFVELKQFEKAKAYFKRALIIREKGNYSRHDKKDCLVYCLKEQKKYEKAREDGLFMS